MIIAHLAKSVIAEKFFLSGKYFLDMELSREINFTLKTTEQLIMRKLLQVDFKYQGPFSEEMANLLKELAESINHEPGFIWKIWTENEKTQQAGGIYLFENEELALNYLEMHSARLQKMGISEVRGKVFAINETLSFINKAPTLSEGEE